MSFARVSTVNTKFPVDSSIFQRVINVRDAAVDSSVGHEVRNCCMSCLGSIGTILAVCAFGRVRTLLPFRRWGVRTALSTPLKTLPFQCLSVLCYCQIQCTAMIMSAIFQKMRLSGVVSVIWVCAQRVSCHTLYGGRLSRCWTSVMAMFIIFPSRMSIA